MDLTIKTKDLQDALSMAASTTTRGGTLVPIVNQVFLSVEGGALTVRATDLERNFSTAVSCEMKKKGRASVNFQRFQNAINLLKTETVRLSVNKSNRLEILADKSTSRIPMAADEFPESPKIECSGVEIGAASFASALRVIMPALEKDRGSVFITTKPGQLRFFGLTNPPAHKFCLHEIPFAGDPDFKMTIGMESAVAVRKMLARGDGRCIAKVGTNGTLIECGEDSIYFVNRDQRAPDFDRIIKRPENSFSVDSQSLTDSLRRAINFAVVNKDTIATADFSGADDEVCIKLGSDLGEANEVLDAEVKGDPPVFRVNANYIISFLAELGGKIEMRYDKPTSPIWVKPADAEFPMMIVMPIR